MFQRTTVAVLLRSGAVALTSVIALAACGSGESGGDRGDVDMAGVSKAEKIVAEYRKPPTWQGPDEPVSVGSLAGKRVTYISVSNAIPVLKYWSDAVTKVVKETAGVQLDVVDAKGSVDEATKGFQQAIASNADAVVLLGFPSDLFKSQIAATKEAGIEVITAQSGIPGELNGGQDAEVTFDYVQVGRLIGAWLVADSQGTGQALYVTSDDVPASQPQARGTAEEVERLCPACDIKTTDVQIPQWESSIPTLFQTTMNTDPNRKYFLPLYDGQALGGLGAIRLTGGGAGVKVAAFNATPGIVEQLKDETSALKLDVGGQNEWYAYAVSDAIFRVLSGTEPIDDYKVGLRIFDTENADLIQGDDELAWYGGADYKSEFEALWKQ